MTTSTSIPPTQQLLIDHQQHLTDYHLAIAATKCGQWSPSEVDRRRRLLIESCEGLLRELKEGERT